MPTPVFLVQFGLGGVGRALVEQVLEGREVQARYGIQLQHTVLADSSGAIVDEQGLDESVIESVVRLKGRGGRLSDHEAGYYQQDLSGLVELVGRPGTIVVDTTAADSTAVMPAFDLALSHEYQIVLANKKPLTDSWERWERLTAGDGIGYEATVGAGLPVISTLRYLADTGDRVHQIEGVFSGTLGYLMSELQRGRDFATIVREAKAKGWTEPDPRDDLSGADVARKALILARTLGYPLGLDQVEVTPLFPPAFAELSLDRFMERLDELNPAFAARLDVAHHEGLRLRYRATLRHDDGDAPRLEVGPAMVAPDSALGTLDGTDNLIAFHTARYAPQPLVIQGAGAGVEVTASALMGDILRLSRSR